MQKIKATKLTRDGGELVLQVDGVAGILNEMVLVDAHAWRDRLELTFGHRKNKHFVSVEFKPSAGDKTNLLDIPLADSLRVVGLTEGDAETVSLDFSNGLKESIYKSLKFLAEDETVNGEVITEEAKDERTEVQKALLRRAGVLD